MPTENTYAIERSTRVVTPGAAAILVVNDIVPVSLTFTDSAVDVTAALLARSSLSVALRLGALANPILIQSGRHVIESGAAKVLLQLDPEQQAAIYRAASTAAWIEFAVSEQSGPRTVYALEGTIELSSASPGVPGGDFNGTFDDAFDFAANAMGALTINTAKALNTKTISADSELLFSGQPTDANTVFSCRLTNSDAAAHTITIPSSISERRGGAIASFVIPANTTVTLTWIWTGTNYLLSGDPLTIEQAHQSLGLEYGNVATRNIPINSQSADYTLVLADAGKAILHPSADTTARTWTIPANASVPFPIGTAESFINQNGAGSITLAITTDTLRLAGAGTTGSRTIAANGIVTAIKIAATEWIVSGTGLS